MASAKNIFSPEQQSEIKKAIAEAELRTSGEIRVHLENHCRGDVLDRAAGVFHALDMHKTAERNGVLFYLAIANHQFAILGDAGINSRVPGDFWEHIRETMSSFFREGQFTEGLVAGIGMAGEALREHFPFRKDDVNELSDEISFGKE